MKEITVIIAIMSALVCWAANAEKPKVWFVGDSIAAGLWGSEASEKFKEAYNPVPSIFVPIGDNPKGTIEPALAEAVKNEYQFDLIVLIAGGHDNVNGKNRREREQMVNELGEVTGAEVFWYDTTTIKESPFEKQQDGIHLSDEGNVQMWAMLEKRILF